VSCRLLRVCVRAKDEDEDDESLMFCVILFLFSLLSATATTTATATMLEDHKMLQDLISGSVGARGRRGPDDKD